jgi:hypothetical protein
MWGQPPSAVRRAKPGSSNREEFIRATSQLNAGTVFLGPGFFLFAVPVNPG